MGIDMCMDVMALEKEIMSERLFKIFTTCDKWGSGCEEVGARIILVEIVLGKGTLTIVNKYEPQVELGQGKILRGFVVRNS